MRVPAVPGLSALATYERSSLRPDALAGLTVWAMLVPQSLGFATLAGLPPVFGLHAAFAAMALYWLWGTSRQLNVGAESTVAIMVATILVGVVDAGTEEYAEAASALAIMVGIVLTIGGILRLGRVADLLSRPVLAGYVFGSGILIVTSQMQGVLGTDIDADPYLTEIGAIIRNLDETAWVSVAFAVATVVIIVTMRRYVPLIPGALVAVIGAMTVVAVFDVDVTVVGEFDSGVPLPGIPDVGWSRLVSLILPAFAVAFLVYPDSVLTARSITQGTGERIDANREFFGLGAANIGAGFFGALPVNGSQSRSFVLRDAGARTQVANLVAAALVLVTLLLLAPVFDYLPLSVLAAIVMVAGFGLLGTSEFRALWRYRRSEFWMAVITIAAVLGLGMLIGIVVAIVLSLALVVARASSPHTAVLGLIPGTDTYRDVADHPEATTVDGLLVYRFDAPLFFANAPTLRDELLTKVEQLDSSMVVIDMESVHDVDSTGAQVLGELLDELDRRGIGLAMARVRTEIRDELQSSGIEGRLADEGIHLEVDDAVTAFHQRGDGSSATG